MVVGAGFPSLEMTESRLQAMAAARSLLDSLPYKPLDPTGGMDALKSASINPYDHNKNSINDNTHSSMSRPLQPGGCISSPSQFQPFTAPWLAEVARITPSSRIGDHLSPFVHNMPTLPTSIPDYYPQYPPRSFYNHPMFSTSHPYLRDYPSRSPVRQYSLLDPRPGSDIHLSHNNPRSSVHPSLGIHSVRSQGQQQSHMYPAPVPEPKSIESDRMKHSLIGDLSSKRRTTGHSNSRNCNKSELKDNSKQCSSKSSMSSPSRKKFKGNSKPQIAKHQQEESEGAYYPHFQKGALVAIGDRIKCVEDMKTTDFIHAADEAEDLVLDPPSVSSIVIASSGTSATILFKFATRKEEISVDPTADHPFFVLNKGWSSCSPEKTLAKYNLPVRQLQVNDLCVSLTKTESKKLKRTQESVQIDELAMPPPSTTNVPTSPSSSKSGAISNQSKFESEEIEINEACSSSVARVPLNNENILLQSEPSDEATKSSAADSESRESVSYDSILEGGNESGSQIVEEEINVEIESTEFKNDTTNDINVSSGSAVPDEPKTSIVINELPKKENSKICTSPSREVTKTCLSSPILWRPGVDTEQNDEETNQVEILDV